MRAGDRILHIFSSNGVHDRHEGEVVAAPTTAAEKKRGFLYNVRYGGTRCVRRACVRKTTASIGNGLRRTNWAGRSGLWTRWPRSPCLSRGGWRWPGATRRSGRKPSTTRTRQWRTMARG